MRALVVAVSTRAAAGVYADRTGPVIVDALAALGFEVGIVDLQNLHAVEHDLAIALFVAFVLQQFLHLVAGTADREALVVE